MCCVRYCFKTSRIYKAKRRMEANRRDTGRKCGDGRNMEQSPEKCSNAPTSPQPVRDRAPSTRVSSRPGSARLPSPSGCQTSKIAELCIPDLRPPGRSPILTSNTVKEKREWNKPKVTEGKQKQQKGDQGITERK